MCIFILLNLLDNISFRRYFEIFTVVYLPLVYPRNDDLYFSLFLPRHFRYLLNVAADTPKAYFWPFQVFPCIPKIKAVKLHVIRCMFSLIISYINRREESLLSERA